MSTLGRDVPQEHVDELVATVVRDEELRGDLVPLIMHMRNHNKSVAEGTGAGERDVAEKLMLGLFVADAPAAIATVGLLAMYGSYRSLSRVLARSDEVEASSWGNFSALQSAVHMVFADRLRADEVEMKAGRPVSNAAKFAPHEKRGKKNALNPRTRHADAIAVLLFPDLAAALDLSLIHI